MKYDTSELIAVLERAAVEQDARVNKDTRGHEWETNEQGHVKVWAGDFHNTITCVKCGYTYCIACYYRPNKDCTK